MPIRALLFDLDDTLLETYPAHRAAVLAACRQASERFPERTPEELRESFLQAYRALEAQVEAGTLQFATVMLFRTRVWEETLRTFDLPHELGAELARMYGEERARRYTLYQEVPQVLSTLGQKYRLVLVTNGPGDLQREKVAAVGLERWIDRIVVSGEVGSWKPHPEIFRRALELAEAGPAEAVMIGDSLERDIHGANTFGIRSVWMRRYAHLHPIEGIRPDVELADMHGLAGAVESLA